MAVNQETVEQTKQQIKSLVNEIATISKSDVPSEEYYPQILQRIISALAAVGGAVWVFDRERDLQLQYQINISETLVEPGNEDASRHNRLIKRVAGAGQSLLVPPYSGTTDSEAEGNPTRFLLVLAPLKLDERTHGMIEIFQRPDSPPKTQQGYLRFLQQMCELMAEWLRGHELRDLGGQQTLWQQADTFARATHESLDLRETAYTVANEGRRLIGCDRVSIALLKGRKCKVESISGQDSIENRSNIVAALNKLATRVVAAGEPLWYDGKTEDLPPQIEEAIEDYVDQSYGREIAVLPLREPARDEAREESKATGELDRDGSHRGEVIGALIVEQIESDLPAELFRKRVNLVYEHGTRALANARRHNNLFLMPVWRTLGKASMVVRARTLPKTLAVVSLLAAVVLALIFVPMDFDLEAEGTLQPTVKRSVFAFSDGEVVEVLARHNMQVKEGDVLVKLRNRDLEVALADVLGQLRTNAAEQLRVSSEASIAERKFDSAEVNRLKGQLSELEEKQRALEQKQQLLMERREQLLVRSPIDGEIVTWDVEEKLRSRPVLTGQELLIVADPSSEWHLELLMPESRMNYLDAAMAKAAPDPLPVEYIMATDPDTKLKGTLVSVAARAEPNDEEGSTVKVRVRPDELSSLVPRPGAKVTGDVKCGERAAGFVIFYPVYEFIVTSLF